MDAIWTEDLETRGSLVLLRHSRANAAAMTSDFRASGWQRIPDPTSGKHRAVATHHGPSEGRLGVVADRLCDWMTCSLLTAQLTATATLSSIGSREAET